MNLTGTTWTHKQTNAKITVITDDDENSNKPHRWLGVRQEGYLAKHFMSASVLETSFRLADIRTPIRDANPQNRPTGEAPLLIEVVEHMPFVLGSAVEHIWGWNPGYGYGLRQARWCLSRVLTTGMSTHPPYKARQKLAEAIRCLPAGTRRSLLVYIHSGNLGSAIHVIDTLVGDKHPVGTPPDGLLDQSIYHRGWMER